ncbi:MAG: tetratricopeptide repeat protein, partial [Myxococcota bacterium]
GRGDHGEATHGLFVYRSTMRVPLVLAAPGLAPGVRPGPLSLVDVAPTVLALAGAPPLPDIDGASFAEGSPAPRVVLGETFLPRDHFGFSELRFAQDATRRLVEAPSPELYDWRADPGEARDLAAAEPAEVARLRAALGAVAPPRAASLDPGLASRLEALGYLTGGGAVDPAVPGASLPNPKDHPDMIELVETLLVTARTRPPADAVPMLGAFLERWPNTPSVRVQLARALALSGRPREGADALAPLLAARPDDPMLLALRGEMRFAAGEDGEPDLTRATALRPTLSSAWATLAERARAAGDPERAADLATRGLAHVPASPALLLVRGAARIDAGDPAAAVDDLLLLVREDAAHPEARYLLGVALARADRAAEAVGPLEAHLAARPDDARAHAMLGLVLQRVERPADALPHLEIALADPAVAGDDLRVALAACLLQTGGDRARAEALLDAAGDRADAHRLRATLRMDEGRVDDALLEMRRARP